MNDKRRQPAKNTNLTPQQSPQDRRVGATHSETVIDGDKIITTRIVEILVEKEDHPIDDIKKLMDAELSYNKQRLAILREHAANHPDAIEDRINLQFRRTQYRYLMLLLSVMVIAMPFAPIHAAVVLGVLSISVTAGILINGRERDPDAGILSNLLKDVVKRK